MKNKLNLLEPTLVINEDICRQNLQRMAERAKRHKVLFRPHFKTHQSIEIGEWFRDAGVTAITVSSIKMATFFAEHGWEDITVAIPVNSLEKDRINRLAKNIELNLLTADYEGTILLDSVLKYPVGLWIKIDIGYNRTGIHFADSILIDSILDIIKRSPNLTFRGFLTHAGQSYNCRSNAEIIEVHQQSVSKMKSVSEKYKSIYPDHKISVGDTPTCSIENDFGLVDEIRPGNFIFYDLMQAQISACGKDEIAIAMACPVVARHAERLEIIFIGGGIHFSKDYILDAKGQKRFGDLVMINENGWSEVVDGCYVSKLSQEHGTLKVTPDVFKNIHAGDIVGILPVHSCMTANLMGGYTTLSSKKLDYFDIRKEYFI
ncbi:MAG: alanine racemase [Saprospiraceae bacterium]|jgi:D-serine deaminase-like pyridoxal phosphate-dependent protein|nr:alanine racemase [Saprospiraceae bacterium]